MHWKTKIFVWLVYCDTRFIAIIRYWACSISEVCLYESEVAQSCLTLCDPMDYSLRHSSVHGIFQARVLEWVAISSPGNLPDPTIKPGSPTLRAEALPSEPQGKPMKGLSEGNMLICLHITFSDMSIFFLDFLKNAKICCFVSFGYFPQLVGS